MRDFLTMTPAEMWKIVNDSQDAAKTRLEELWTKAGDGILTEGEANECLDVMYIHTMARIRQKNATLASQYPTYKYSRNRFANKDAMWWVDHFTAGISVWSTLSWFSGKKVDNPASTHFVIDYHGLPYCIIPIQHGAWHCPVINSASISVEMVNAGPLSQDKNGKWLWWTKTEVPLGLTQELPPVMLDKPWRGVRIMQPFTPEQVENNIKLKRVVLAAMPGKFDRVRMSQHSDWQAGKLDMGPLWPFKDANDAAFEPMPLDEYSFLHNVNDGYLGNKYAGMIPETSEHDSPEYGEVVVKAEEEAAKTQLDTTAIQTLLNKLGYPLVADGVYGPRTHDAVKSFQNAWNIKHERDDDKQLVVDGIAGPQTQAALQIEKSNK